MNSVIVITKKSWSARMFADLASQRWAIRDVDESRCVVENYSVHVIINRDDTIENDYDEEEFAAVLRMVPDPQFFLVEFNDFEFGKEVLALLINAGDIAVDDDHGNLLRGNDFSSRIRNNSSYDWR